MIQVLLVDDHKILRDGIKALISHNKKIKIAGECSDGSEVLEFLSKTNVDVILMDIKMTTANGIETTRDVVAKFPEIKILALSMHNEETYISKMLDAGASGYILKNTGEEEMIRAIETVYEGGIYFSEEVTKIMMSKYMKKGKHPLLSNGKNYVEDLTKREKEILQLIVSELTNNEIAEKLFISPRTVDTHRRNLLQKLGVKNTAGLVKFALQSNLSESRFS